ncbi:MAG: sulfide/dihydroorotate dehydrogenase-like FAD/NAD-binding protein [Candidatus Omnitrophota bacterium]
MKILKKDVLAETPDTKTTKIEVHAPLIARKAKPGQFVVLMVKEEGERIPLTIVKSNKNSGTIVLIFQELGLTTKLLGKLNEGNSLYALAGPLGHATDIKKYGKVILIGGGVGIAEIYPVAKAMKKCGNHVTTIIGARTKALLILEDELRATSDELHAATDDGSYGKKGFTTDILAYSLPSFAKASEGRQLTAYSLVYAVGPIPMMKKVCEITKGFNVKTIVSLNALMVDGTGMCGSCRVSVNNEVKFSCIDGPEFDGHLVNWEELEKRSRIYEKKEKHICNLYKL